MGSEMCIRDRILAGMLLPALAKAKTKAHGIACMNNTNQMIKAFHLYAGDEDDYIPPNHDDGNSQPFRNWCSGQAGNPQLARFMVSGPSPSDIANYKEVSRYTVSYTHLTLPTKA